MTLESGYSIVIILEAMSQILRVVAAISLILLLMYSNETTTIHKFNRRRNTREIKVLTQWVRVVWHYVRFGGYKDKLED